MFCVKCGAETMPNAAFCTWCGARLGYDTVSKTDGCAKDAVQTTDPNDEGGWIWAMLSFFVPLVGLILLLIWRKERPNTASWCEFGLIVWGVLAAIGLVLGMIALVVIGFSLI